MSATRTGTRTVTWTSTGQSYLPDWPNGSKNYPTTFQYAGPFTVGGHTYPQVQFETDVGGSSNLCNTDTGAGLHGPADQRQVLPVLVAQPRPPTVAAPRPSSVATGRLRVELRQRPAKDRRGLRQGRPVRDA